MVSNSLVSLFLVCCCNCFLFRFVSVPYQYFAYLYSFVCLLACFFVIVVVCLFVLSRPQFKKDALGSLVIAGGARMKLL